MKKFLLALTLTIAASAAQADLHSQLSAQGDYLADVSRECSWSMKVHKKWNSECDTMYSKRTSMVNTANGMIKAGTAKSLPQSVVRSVMRGLDQSQLTIDYAVEAGYRRRVGK